MWCVWFWFGFSVCLFFCSFVCLGLFCSCFPNLFLNFKLSFSYDMISYDSSFIFLVLIFCEAKY